MQANSCLSVSAMRKTIGRNRTAVSLRKYERIEKILAVSIDSGIIEKMVIFDKGIYGKI